MLTSLNAHGWGLTAKHDSEVVGELDHASAAAANGARDTFGDVGWDEGGDHADTETAHETAKVEDAEGS